jgi:hypothetical protein
MLSQNDVPDPQSVGLENQRGNEKQLLGWHFLKKLPFAPREAIEAYISLP